MKRSGLRTTSRVWREASIYKTSLQCYPSLCHLGLTPITHKNGAEAHLSQAPQLCYQIKSAPGC